MISLVTTLTNSFVPALSALLASLVENAGCECVMTVVAYEEISNRDALERVGIPLEWVDVRDLGEIPRPGSRTPRMEVNLQKPLIWRLPGTQTRIYLDSDTLCLGALDEMQEWDELTAVRKQTSHGKSPDYDKDYRPSGRYPWNAGVFAFRPSEETFAGIARQAAEYEEPVHYGDQVILVDYFNQQPTHVREVDNRWNMPVWLLEKFPECYSADIRILHFNQDEKPWTHDPKTVSQRPFWDIWNWYYRRSAGEKPGPKPKVPEGMRFMRRNRNRTGLRELIREVGGGVMVEVGSYAGESAELFARSRRFKRIHCVDPWNLSGDIEARFDAVLERCPQIQKHKQESLHAAQDFGDGTLDFVYIDARHDYESVAGDIRAWNPKVRSRGWIGGHDYSWKFPGVIQAVYETFGNPHRVFQDGSWLVRKG